ncbi:CHAD domain-containing protein [Paucibacter sp. B2R-40]|uniref:CHAD domain-containing protein n=1 Tax=Paucibacter sp. B2R-40 TaxID=2893554 RepID=UPI0021E4304A|nr:CHAD domain-containing protein [Paucibacter sp. B2R-40]MCV2352932.1 CHAD domain-containing protein [Paucibacter sp. B2R-40]
MPNSLKPSKARPVKLRPGITLEQGFIQIARNCLRQVRANEAGLRHSAEAEFVHQMRVGLRRLRSALVLFKPWIAPPPALLAELAWLGQRLGAARDAEVLAGSTLPNLMALGPSEDLQVLLHISVTTAKRRRGAAARTLKTERYQALVKQLEQWLKACSWRADAPRPTALGESLAPAAAAMLRRRKKKLRAAALKAQAQPSAAARHQLRIAVKKMRYANEFFGTLEAAKGKATLAQLSALQDLLGQNNDAEVARLLLLDLAQAQPALLEQAAFARGMLWAQSQQRIASLGPLLRGLGLERVGPSAST